MSSVPHPPIVEESEWRAARVRLLSEEKALTKERDRVNAARRRLPMVRVEKAYTFHAPEGEITLEDLFAGKRQLVVYHFMFDPEWEEGCTGCTGYTDALGDLSLLPRLDTTFALVSRAPLEKLLRYKAERGWTGARERWWVSSFGSDFNYDFHATADRSKAPPEYNYRSEAEWKAQGMAGDLTGEQHGMSVFFRIEDGPDAGIYHTYSSFGRGVENVTDANSLLDLTPYGRQESFEDSPEGWPQHPTYEDPPDEDLLEKVDHAGETTPGGPASN